MELLAGAIALAGVSLIGTLWYWLVEGWSLELNPEIRAIAPASTHEACKSCKGLERMPLSPPN